MWQAYRTRKMLNALSDEQLADIGVVRDDIALVAAQVSKNT